MQPRALRRASTISLAIIPVTIMAMSCSSGDEVGDTAASTTSTKQSEASPAPIETATSAADLPYQVVSGPTAKVGEWEFEFGALVHDADEFVEAALVEVWGSDNAYTPPNEGDEYVLLPFKSVGAPFDITLNNYFYFLDTGGNIVGGATWPFEAGEWSHLIEQYGVDIREDQNFYLFHVVDGYDDGLLLIDHTVAHTTEPPFDAVVVEF